MTRQELLAIVCSLMKEISFDPLPVLTEDTHFKQIDFNSLDRIELASALMRKYKTRIPRTAYLNMQTIGQLLDVFELAVQGKSA